MAIPQTQEVTPQETAGLRPVDSPIGSAAPQSGPARPKPPAPEREGDLLQRDLEALEERLGQAVQELKNLRAKVSAASLEREAATKREWANLDHKWFTGVLSAATFFFILSFYIASTLGYYHDQTPLPGGVVDAVLSRLPVVDLVPVLSYGWLLTHMFALYVGVVYYPRRLPYLLGTIGLLVVVRTVFVALNPVGAPPGILNLNASYLFQPLRGVLAFDNEFFFSGHTALPYLYSLAVRERWLKFTFLAASVAMAVAVLLTRNHYTMDVLGAYFITYSVYRLSRHLLGWLDPED